MTRWSGASWTGSVIGMTAESAAELRSLLDMRRRNLQRLRTERGLLDGRIVVAQQEVYEASRLWHEALDREQRDEGQSYPGARHVG